MKALLDDETTYKKLPSDPTDASKNAIIAALAPIKEYVPPTVYWRIYPYTTQPPLYFGNPKIHKEGLPMRPIVSARDTIFSGLTRDLGRILVPLVGHTQHHLRYSADLVDKLRDVVIPSTHRLYSFDLTNMYTNIPTSEAIILAGERLNADTKLKERTPIKPEDVIRLLKLDIELAYFRYGGEFYAQPRGLGMGKSTSSPLSDIFMESLEQNALAPFTHRESVLFWLL